MEHICHLQITQRSYLEFTGTEIVFSPRVVSQKHTLIQTDNMILENYLLSLRRQSKVEMRYLFKNFVTGKEGRQSVK